MKHIILIMFTIVSIMFNTADAGDGVTLSLKISNPPKNNRYFLCIYGAGCYSLKAGSSGKQFPIPAMDVGNIKKFVVTDTSNMRVYLQSTDRSCNFTVGDNETLKISGHLVVKNSIPYISGLHCSR